MQTLYDIVIQLLYGWVKIRQLTNSKARDFVKNRKNWVALLSQWKSANHRPVIWIHVASLGEFYQGKPVLDMLFEHYGDSHRYLCTFFSPSGYNILKNQSHYFDIFYLPIDTQKNANYFVKTLDPVCAIFVKYEFWCNLLFELKRAAIPTFLIAGIFRENQIFFKPYGAFFRKALGAFSIIFLQDDYSARLIKRLNIDNTVCGDPRIDHILERKKLISPSITFKTFKNNQPILIIGSCWGEDLDIILDATAELLYLHDNLKVVIAPHEISNPICNRIITTFKKKKISSLLYSTCEISTEIKEKRVLIIDKVGPLFAAYAYANIAFIGGGFGVGLHNILEPASFGLPVLFGNISYKKFKEAHNLLALKTVYTVKNADEYINKIVPLLDSPSKCAEMGEKSMAYLKQSKGASKKIIHALIPFLS